MLPFLFGHGNPFGTPSPSSNNNNNNNNNNARRTGRSSASSATSRNPSGVSDRGGENSSSSNNNNNNMFGTYHEIVFFLEPNAQGGFSIRSAETNTSTSTTRRGRRNSGPSDAAASFFASLDFASHLDSDVNPAQQQQQQQPEPSNDAASNNNNNNNNNNNAPSPSPFSDGSIFSDFWPLQFGANAAVELLFLTTVLRAGMMGGASGNPCASAQAIERLPVIKVKHPEAGEEEESADTTCIICQDNMEGVAVQMPCAHMFHKDCLVPWLKQRNTCPTCRCEIETDDAEYNAANQEKIKSIVVSPAAAAAAAAATTATNIVTTTAATPVVPVNDNKNHASSSSSSSSSSGLQQHTLTTSSSSSSNQPIIAASSPSITAISTPPAISAKKPTRRKRFPTSEPCTPLSPPVINNNNSNNGATSKKTPRSESTSPVTAIEAESKPITRSSKRSRR